MTHNRKTHSNKARALYGISRIDDETHRTHAWRVSLRRQGKMHIKNFPDKKHAGKKMALVFAKQFRDDVLINYPPTTRRQFCSAIRGNNRTGISGVYTYPKRYMLSNGRVRETWYWEANWPDENHQSVSVSFSVKTYGEDIAKQMAIRARQAGLETVKGVFWASERGEIEVDKSNMSCPSLRDNTKSTRGLVLETAVDCSKISRTQ
jgi:hypothetical protein